jgi:hypothetical protein
MVKRLGVSHRRPHQSIDDIFQVIRETTDVLGINLRADLARLSDSDLAAELNRMIEYRLARFGAAPTVGSLKGLL